MKPQLWQIPTPDSDTLFSLPEKTEQLISRLQEIVSQHQNIKFASSLAVEDMLITDAIARHHLPITVFTLQTGRLNAETVQLIDAVKQNYPQLNFEIYEPNAQAVEQFVQNHGSNAFYDSVALRRECCHIRKIEPLNRAIDGADAWLTGQRREQSVTRNELPFAEHDTARNIAKYNPIADWSELDVWAYILQNNIVYNELYKQGYPSIGCEPCTMPVKLGDDIRAGRWWWENRDSKECGLHK